MSSKNFIPSHHFQFAAVRVEEMSDGSKVRSVWVPRGCGTRHCLSHRSAL